MNKSIRLMNVGIFLLGLCWTLRVPAGIEDGVYISGTVYSFNKETVTLHQKEHGLAVTIPRALVKNQTLKAGEKMTFFLDSTEGVKSKPLRNKASATSKKRSNRSPR